MAFFRTVKIFNPLLKIVKIHKTTMPSKKPGIVVCNFFLYFVIPSNANKNAYSLALSFNTLKIRRRLGSWHTKQYFFLFPFRVPRNEAVDAYGFTNLYFNTFLISFIFSLLLPLYS